MEPLYNLTDKNKETSFNAFIYDVIEEIDNATDKWFKDTFINKSDYIVKDVLDSNLCMDLDYLFTKAIWLIELGKALGYNREPEQFVQSYYDTYTTKGFKHLVNDNRYDRINEKLFTKKQVKENEKRSNDLMMKILKEIIP